MTVKAKNLSPDDIGRLVTVHGAVFRQYNASMNYDTRTGSGLSQHVDHAIRSITGVLVSVSGRIDSEPRRLLRRVKTVDIRLDSLNLIVNPDAEVTVGERVEPEDD